MMGKIRIVFDFLFRYKAVFEKVDSVAIWSSHIQTKWSYRTCIAL